MDIRKLQRAIVDGLEDVKAQNIAVFNTEHLSPLFERVIIASGTSNRQTRSLAGSVREAVKDAGFGVPRMEGEANGEWIIVDCGPAVVHVMQPSIRDYYHLEEIWGGKPVRMKLGEDGAGALRSPASNGKANGRAAKSAADLTPAALAALRLAASQRPAGKVAAKKTAAKKTVAKTATVKTAAKKAPAKKAAPRRASSQVVTRVVGVKSSGARRPAAKKAPAAKQSPRRPAAAKRSTRA
jgi:ribosome-associated protein